MGTVAYNCPCCGAPLSFSSERGKLACAACGNQYEVDVIEEMNAPEGSEGIHFDMAVDNFGDEEDVQSYICKSCGAELITEGTTTATECPYCGSPTVLPDRIKNGVKPEKVIPFVVTKEQAQQQFEEYFKGKKLMPNIFLNSRNRISDMRKLYVPYWLFDCDAEADIVYNAEKRRTERQGDWEIERIRHYSVRRGGSMSFENIPVDGSVKLDNKITESLEPYDLTQAVAFQPAVLAGAMADHADVNAAECEGRAVERVETSIADALRNTVDGYDSVSERHRNIAAKGAKVTPVLMPVWLITTEKEGKTYTFAINGQTGKLTCDVPADVKKSLAWGGGVFGGVMAVLMLILYLMESMGSGTILMAAIAAMVAALGVVFGLKAQLKQAVYQSAAANYVVEGSVNIPVRYDHFLYETTHKRKIERENKN